MTARTHDLAAFTALTAITASQLLPIMSLPTVLVAMGANFIGALIPDIDEPSAKFWRNLRGGTIISVFISPLFGGHRFISHSLVGLALFGFLASKLLELMHTFVLTDMRVVWWAFMVGYLSHLVFDSFTKEGVPWLFPLPIKFGIPPLKGLRITTGGNLEKFVVFPGLLAINIYLFYAFYPTFYTLLKSLFR